MVQLLLKEAKPRTLTFTGALCLKIQMTVLLNIYLHEPKNLL